ncbi:hypothetical protein [Gimesia aquarii]|uniref:Uncharacterized protein n=1 Tax=Gimesia aquarii TaxID=2527964 RepID=A0A517VR97_9PLAN|nr:hypothetical protein [Gimesia aquarii]QDT95527.1 hypothetical protein V144x_09720 [Gimesia aquarii]
MTDQKQLEFNFKRGAKLAIINKIMRRNIFNSRMLLVLRSIDDCARDQAVVTMTYNEIAAFLHMSRATAKRGVANLIEYDLLHKTPVINSQGKQANEYQLIWSNLQSIADGEPLVKSAPVRSPNQADENSETPAPDLEYESSQVVNSASGQIEADPGHPEPSDGSHRPPDPGHGDPSLLIPLSRINPPPSNTALVTISPERVAVEKELRLMGVGLASEAIETALARGCSLDDVLQLIQYARSKPDAYGPGALKKRVCEALPGEDPSKGWPPESDEFLKQQRQAEAQKQGCQASQKTAEREAKRKANQRAQQELERKYGPQLDRLKRDELLDFVKTHCEPIIVRALAQNPDMHRSPGFYRVTLLEALRDQANGLPG